MSSLEFRICGLRARNISLRLWLAAGTVLQCVCVCVSLIVSLPNVFRLSDFQVERSRKYEGMSAVT